jgi:hypothetical protein
MLRARLKRKSCLLIPKSTKVKKSKKGILTHPSGPQSNLKQISVKIVVSILCAYATKDFRQ